MQLKITQSTGHDDLARIEALASDIWYKHYTPIIGREQVAYMLDKFQSLSAMNQQISQQNYLYFSIYDTEELIGYFAIQPQSDCIMLSKLYIHESQRGKGIARKAIEKIIQLRDRLRHSVVRLTVNKYNTNSIAAYQAMGFKLVGEDVFDIGSGYVMDDYILEMSKES